MTDEEIKALSPEEYGRALREARKKRGLNARDAASALDMTATALTNYEAGREVKRFDKVELMRWMRGEQTKLPQQFAWRSWRNAGDESTEKAREWAKALIEAREKRGWNQGEAAEALGVARSTYCRWEIGGYMPGNMLPDEVLAYVKGDRQELPKRIAKSIMRFDGALGRWVPIGEDVRARDNQPSRREAILAYAPHEREHYRRIAEENEKIKRIQEQQAERKRKRIEARAVPAGTDKRCIRCGAEKKLPADYPVCKACRDELKELKKGRKLKTYKDIRILNREMIYRQMQSMRAANDLFQWRCLGCAHCETLGANVDIFCGYINDAENHLLPRRSHPNADPCGCIYASDRESLPTRISREEARRIMTAPGAVVIDRWLGRVYAGMEEACLATGQEPEQARRMAAEVRRKGLNATKARLRWANEEEIEMLSRVAAGEWEE